MIRTMGINYIALICRDMKGSAAFYSKAPGMALFKTAGVPAPEGGPNTI